jgi:hypothetical protein
MFFTSISVISARAITRLIAAASISSSSPSAAKKLVDA